MSAAERYDIIIVGSGLYVIHRERIAPEPVAAT